MPLHTETTWNLLVEGAELAKIAKVRAKDCIELSVCNKDVQSYYDKGWELKKEGKTKTQITKKKSVGDAFEDELWTIFYNMGFKVMNSTNQFALSTSDDHSLGKQIDIIAIDDETCIFIECKEAVAEGTVHDFRQDITEMAYNYPKLCAEIKKKYPNRKTKYIFATKNYKLGETNRQLLSENKIFYFDSTSVEYYKSLSDYIGSASRYQLLSSLFAGTKISEMDATVPAVRGTMGGLDYYTFLIEPERLLKLGYVLHRTNSNKDFEELLPSYQRLIKKDRLKSVREFINKGGYFPNSLVVSIDAKRPLQFDVASQPNNSLSKIGILHLPQVYQSVYIIDGQHRLYGYSESEYAKKNTIPVVAFVNLDKEEQLKLFFDINENQKAVSKTLRNILEITIYDDSENPNLRRKALLGKISKKLGEDRKSAWFGKIAIGEDEKCNITLEYVKAAFDKTNFFTKYKKNGTVLKKGQFDGSTNDEIMSLFYPFFLKCINTVADNCPNEWNSNGYLSTNNSAAALIMVIGDIVDIVTDSDKSLLSDPKVLYEACKDLIESLCITIIELPADRRNKITEARGAAAKDNAHRVLQMEMHNNFPSFTNSEIESYYSEYCINYNDNGNDEILYIIKEIIEFIKSKFADDEAFYKHAGHDLHEDLSIRLLRKKMANERNGIFEEPVMWEELTINDIQRAVSNGKNWSDVYAPWLKEKGYTDTKLNFIGLLKSLSEYQHKIRNGQHITLTNYNSINEFYKVLKGKDV